MAQAAPASTNGPSATVSMTLQEAVSSAVQSHPSLRSARNRVRRAAAGINTAQANYYPDVSFGINSEFSGDRIDGYDSSSVQRAQLNVSQLLYDFGRTGSLVDRARRKKGLAQAQMQKAYAHVVRQTAKAWLQVRKYRALVSVARQQREAVQDLFDLAKQRDALGASTHADTTQARARVEAAQAQLVRVRSQARRWRSILMHWTGTAAPPQITTDTSLVALNNACLEVDRPGAVRHAAPVRVARVDLRVAQASVEVAGKKLLPKLSLNASVGHGIGGNSQPIRGDGMNTTVTLNMSVPLFKGGALRSSRTAAIYGARAAQAALQQARLAASRHLQSTLAQWQRYSRLRQTQQQRAHSMRVTRKLYRRQFLKLGTRSLLDLLNAEQEYYGALSDIRMTRYHLDQLAVGCLYYTGRLHDAFRFGSREFTDNEVFSLAPDSLALGVNKTPVQTTSGQTATIEKTYALSPAYSQIVPRGPARGLQGQP